MNALGKCIKTLEQHNIMNFMNEVKDISQQFITNGFTTYAASILKINLEGDTIWEEACINLQKLAVEIYKIMSSFFILLEKSEYFEHQWKYAFYKLFSYEQIRVFAQIKNNLEFKLDEKISDITFFETSRTQALSLTDVYHSTNHTSRLLDSVSNCGYLPNSNDEGVKSNFVEHDAASETALSPFCHWDTFFQILDCEMKDAILNCLTNITKMLQHFDIESGNTPFRDLGKNDLKYFSKIDSDDGILFFIPRSYSSEIRNLIKKLLDSKNVDFSYSVENARFKKAFSGSLKNDSVASFTAYDRFILQYFSETKPDFFERKSLGLIRNIVELNHFILRQPLFSKIYRCYKYTDNFKSDVITNAAILQVLKHKIETFQQTAIPDSTDLSLLLSRNSEFIRNCNPVSFSNYFLVSICSILQSVRHSNVTLVTKRLLKKILIFGGNFIHFNPLYMKTAWLSWRYAKDFKCIFCIMTDISIKMAYLVWHCLVRDGFGINIVSKMGQYAHEVRQINYLQLLCNLNNRFKFSGRLTNFAKFHTFDTCLPLQLEHHLGCFIGEYEYKHHYRK